jgi:glutathione synthase
MRQNIGVIMRDSLESLVNDESLEGDYEFAKRISNSLGNYKNLKEESDFSGIDLVLFFPYPYNKGLAEKLVKYEDEIPFINSPSGVLRTSEKTFEYEEFKDLVPATKTLTSQVSYDDIEGFARNFDSVVVKPVDGTGGKGVYFIDKPYNEESFLELKKLADEKNGRYVMQEYIENDGDKRILCYNGIVLGGFGRRSDTSRIHNASGGGKILELKATPEEIKMAERVSERLKEYRVYFSGLDVIDGKLIEVNTSMPGGTHVMTPYRFSSVDDAYKAMISETKKIIGSYK